MTVIYVDIGSADQRIDASNYKAGEDSLVVNGLGNHTLTIDGVYAPTDIGFGVQATGTPTIAVINGGDLELSYGLADVSTLSGMNYVVDDRSTIYINGAPIAAGTVASNTITFTGNGGGLFMYNPSEASGPTVTTFTVNRLGVNDTLGISNRNNGTLVYDPASKIATLEYGYQENTGDEVVRFEIPNISQEDFDVMVNDYGTSGIGAFTSLVCFLRGTMILTSKGETSIQELVPGDVVIGKSGERTVKWVGFRRTVTRQIPTDRRAEHMPIRIMRDAIAENVPSKDIVVSPGHHLFVQDKLVRAKDLLNGKTIYQETHHRSHEYIHVELDQFDVISAHGIMSESWADGGNRDYFQNADVTLLRPEDRKRRQADRPGFEVVRNKAEIKRLQAVYAARAEEIEVVCAKALKVGNA